ncbi:hypothetical protein [Levilactobacillus namurensis]|uniref:hypothetical protein n=1 Tax=Levilactobacillus namurensis TaxID=380393 RepID=UPI0004636E0F|nr:hypothetical protein [Levilactobacillus namurensis]
MNRAPNYLPILHEIEAKYGSISKAPESDVNRVQKAAGVVYEPNKKPLYERGRHWQAFFEGLDTTELTSYEILMAARKDENLSKNHHISIGTVYHVMKKYGIKYRKMSEV